MSNPSRTSGGSSTTKKLPTPAPQTNQQPMASGFLTNAGIAAGGVGSGNKSNHVQVIFNGRILTPQSLIVRKHKGGSTSDSKTQKPKQGIKNQIHTIDEVTPINEKVQSNKQSLAPNLAKKASELLTPGTIKMGSRAIVKAGIASTQAHLEETVVVSLTETSTCMHMSIPSQIVASDTRDVMAIDERNTRYEAVVLAHKNADAFNSRPTQTKNNPLKNQNEMAAPNAFRDFASQAISFEILDATGDIQSGARNLLSEEIIMKTAPGASMEVDDSDPAGLSSAVRKFVNETVGVSLVTPGCLLDTTTVIKPVGHADAQNNSNDRTGKSGTLGKSGGKKNVSGYSNNANSKQISGGFSGDHGDAGNSGSGSNSNKGGSGFLQTSRGVANAGAGPGVSNSSTGSGNHSQSGLGAFDNPAGAGGHAAAGDSRGGSRANFSNTDNNMGHEGSQYSDVAFTEEDSLQIIREAEIKKILSSPLLLKRLQLVERAVQQNANHRAQLDYRDLPDIAPLTLLSSASLAQQEKGQRGKGDNTAGLGGFGGKGLGGLGGATQLGKNKSPSLLESMSSKGGPFGASTSGNDRGNSHQQSRGKKPIGGPLESIHSADGEEMGPAEKVRKLFSFSNPSLVQNRSVTAMAWNTASSDLLAVGYGKTDVFSDTYEPGEALDEGKLGGLVLFWSLRNPDYPEKILRTAQPVTALDFSKLHPMTLAVGLLNGDINIYDVKREGEKFEVPVESSAGMDNCHTDPVWQVKWIMKGVERVETLVSISSDGSILEWNLKKGLVMSTLMQLKKSGTGDGWISNSAAGLCFDFHPADPSTYVTGTEDGSIHRCSVSYNEQYLDTYDHHEGPVYRLRFSPRWPEVFLSCSADWSMNLYHLKSKHPMLSIRATGEDFPINDICWCPGNSTVFACVTMDARLQIWDLSVSAIDPVISVDIAADAELEALGAAQVDENGVLIKDKITDSPPSSPPAAAATGSLYPTGNRYAGLGTELLKEEDLLSPTAKLLKALNADSKKKTLTCLLFGEKTPIIVVGDSRGTVFLYRIFNPVTITHQGPLQQVTKLKHAVAQQTDPVSAAIIQQQPVQQPQLVTTGSGADSNTSAGIMM